MLRIRRGRENREKRERKQRLKVSNALYIISGKFNTWNCLYIDSMCSTSKLGLKPSKPTISL